MSGLKKMGCLLFVAIMGLGLGRPPAAAAKEALAAGEAQAAAEAKAAALAGRLINLEGDVTVRPAGKDRWEAAQINQDLYAGDAVRTGGASRASVLCLDESQIKLNENTILILKQVNPSPRLRLGEVVPTAEAAPQSIYQVPQGEIWLRNKYENFRFELETPAVTAALRGTEINVRVRRDGLTSVILLDGKICLANAQGEVCLLPGEEGQAAPGQAPTKHILVRPLDAVQWSLYYPGIFSFRDLPFGLAPEAARTPAGPPALIALVQQGEAAYDRGDLAAAKAAAQDALRQSPDHSRALTLLGWVALQEFAPQEAKEHFQRVKQPDDMAVIGLGLARYRLGNPGGAYELVSQARRTSRPSWLLNAMGGYFALMVGKVEEARGLLTAAAGERPEAALPRALLAQIELVQNRRDAARALASQALSQNPNSPLANFTVGLVDIASFDLKAARTRLEKAVELDRRFVDAYVYLAKIWLGSEYLARAQKTIDQALALDPRDANVLSLAGFVRLAHRDFEGAHRFFRQAVQANPSLGEPYLGLSIYHFRHRDAKKGLEEALTATLLDPRVALYQTEVGKALYQSRAFNKALDVFDYAKTLDPKDPTPYLYKGIALSDLNRPGEAVQEINKSIELNDNTALFKTRLTLDRDLAVRNYNLARSFDQLGLKEWAFSKAITAIKKDPYNSSAQLFLSKSYITSTQGPFASFAAYGPDLMFRLLSPANQNTFLSMRNDNYTSMYEMPYVRLLAQGGIGAWRERNTIQDHDLVVYGGRPGLGAWVQGFYFDDRGLRDRNSQLKQYSIPYAIGKWEITPQTGLMATIQYVDTKAGDIGFLNDWSYTTDPFFRLTQRSQSYELGLVHRFNPQATLVAYGTYQKWNFFHIDDPNPVASSDREFYNFQVQQNLVLGPHNIIGGIDYFSGRNYFRIPSILSFRTPERAFSFYLFDYWRLHPKVLLELGVIGDYAKSSRDGSPSSLSNSQWSPIFGLNWYITPQHTLRLGYQRHMMTHAAWNAFTLIPTETAGLPWLVFANPGSDMRNAGVSWEAEWGPKTFSLMRFEAVRISTPEFNDAGQSIWQTWNTYRAILALNHILANPLGITVGVVGQRVIPDQNFTAAQFSATQPFTAYYELRSFLALNFLHRTGWQAGVKTTLLSQFFPSRDDVCFPLVDLRLGKEFANKRGLATLEVNNLFDRHFFYAVEPTFNQDLFPGRRLMFKLALYF